MKLLFKPALTAKWPSGKGLGRSLNCRWQAISRDKIWPHLCACSEDLGNWIMASPLQTPIRYCFGPSNWIQSKAGSHAAVPG